LIVVRSVRSIEKCATSWRLSLLSQNKSARTLETYLAAVQQLNAFLVEHGFPTDVTAVEREHVEAYIASLLEEWSDSTASVRYRALQQFFKWLLEEDEIASSPMERMKAPTVREKPVEVFVQDEIDRLIKVCNGKDFTDRRDTAIIRLLDDTGMRRSELCGMTVDDVSLESRHAVVIGKGGKPRPCAFSPETGLALDRYLRAREDHALADRPELWLGRLAPLTGNGLGQMLRRRGEQAGVEHVHAHRFRHTMAHQWKMAGGNDTALMAQAGWSSRQMVDRYGKSAQQDLAKVEFDRVRDAGRRAGAR
jgi:site-specific recombinase XerD